MLKYVTKRLLGTIPTTLGILLLTFILFNVVGGSPAAVILGKNATAEAIAAFDHKWGYDQPILVQFANFVGGICRGDFGYSIENHEPVYRATVFENENQIVDNAYYVNFN